MALLAPNPDLEDLRMISVGSPSIIPTATPPFQRVTSEDRARLSGPGLRTFRAISDEFRWSEAIRMELLGDPSPSTYRKWMKKAAKDKPVSLPRDTLMRISAVLGIYRDLHDLFENQKQTELWLTGPHEGPAFSGTSPLEVMCYGGYDGLMLVRRYLIGWLQGQAGSGAAENDFEPVTEADLEIV